MTSLMRHFLLALSVTALPFCMSTGTTERALIAGAGTALQRVNQDENRASIRMRELFRRGGLRA